MAEEKVYCRYKGEHSQKQGLLGEPRVNVTLTLTESGEEKGRGEPGDQETRGQEGKG